MARTLLIVDDVEVNRRILRKTLGREYAILEASNGQEAFDIAVKNCGALSAILLDVVMPVMDGYEMLRRLRGNADTAQIPAIVITGSEEESARVKALSLGANDFIVKPYNPDIIRHCLRNNIALCENASMINAIQRDKLTGLYTREAFFERAASMIAAHEPGYYLMASFDINNFKLINDQYGTPEGDRILQYVGRAILEDMEEFDGVGSRISADNFAVLYPVESNRLDFVEKLHGKQSIPDELLSPTAFSIGRYVVTDTSLAPSAIYDRAYIAKQSVKGRYDAHLAYFDEAMLNDLVRKQQIIADMDVALRKKQFEVWFQPQYNHTSGALIGAEALARWRHPQRGLVSPGLFIPVFEQNGFIYEMDKYIWEEACRYLRKWLDEGRSPLPVSVNISRYDIFKADLLDVIVGLTEKYGIPADLLRLEITESAFAKSTQRIVSIVKRLIEKGFTLEIDDFGSGYSSLNTLKSVPAQVVKLDMRFLENDDDSQRGGNILESVVRMTKWLGMSVIAEGVETVEQANYLKSIGCYYVQGYLYARPMPAADYETAARGVGKEEKLLTMETVKNLNANAFWNPKSMETLIFNSYIGGACIFEYYGEGIELLRANDKFAAVFGGADMTVEDTLKLNWIASLSADSRKSVKAALERAIETGDEASGEYAFVGIPHCPPTVYLRATMRVIATAGERYLVYCTAEDITAQRIAEQRERETERRRLEAADQLRFLNETAHDLLSQPDAESGLTQVLRKLLDYFGGKRAHICEFTADNSFADNTYEVCAPGAESRQRGKRRIPCGLLEYWLDSFAERGYVHIDDVETLDENRADKPLLRSLGIRSLVAVPLERDGRRIGFIGVDDPRQQHSHIDRLVALGDYIAVMLTRRDLNARISNDAQTLSDMMNDTPGGFVRLRVGPNASLSLDYFNDGFCHLVGMERERILSQFAENALLFVHPSDADTLREAIGRVRESGEARGLLYRLRHGQGDYVRVLSFARLLRVNGEIFLNVYFADASERDRVEEQRRELLDNLPYGAGICEVSGDTARMTYLNRRYREYFQRDVGGASAASVFDVLHPDDRPMLREAIRPALAQGGRSSCVVRIQDQGGKYLAFRLEGTAMECSGNKNAIYVTFVPLSREELSVGEMLSVALRAMIESQTDYAFAKDRRLRYVCCSRAMRRLTGLADGEDVAGKTDYDLFDRSLADAYAAEDRRILESGQPLVDRLERLTSDDGAPRYAVTSKFPLYDSLGAVIGIYGLSRDVTKAREADSRLKLLTNSIPGGIATYECSPGSARITYFNDGFCALFGFTRRQYELASVENPLCCVLEEYVPVLMERLDKLLRNDTPIDCVYRARLANGEEKWINLKALASDRRGETATVNAVLFDVTARQDALERLRVSEEENRLAMRHSGSSICRYRVADRSLTVSLDHDAAATPPARIENAPDEPIRSGQISPETAEAYASLFAGIERGAESGGATFQLRSGAAWRWLEARYSTIFSDAGDPVSAVISCKDITEQREKEAVFRKWQQSLREKDQSSYTLYRCNISKNTSFDNVEGSLLRIRYSAACLTFDERTEEYVEQCVLEEDKRRYTAFLRSDALLASYYRGKRSGYIEYRESLPGGDARWLSLTVDLVEYPDSTDVEAYLMYENIDERKRRELQTELRAETDPLTGVLNRAAFAARVERWMRSAQPGARHALLMLDIDGFKQVNDALGHDAGDRAIIGMASRIRSALRRDDPLGRLGGDEFLIFLKDVPGEDLVSAKAEQIRALARESFGANVNVSGSIGVAMFPRDGKDFPSLYKRADEALYRVKSTGKDGYAFYRGG